MKFIEKCIMKLEHVIIRDESNCERLRTMDLTYLSSTKIQFTSTEDLHSSYIHMRGSDPRSMNYGLSSSQLHLFVVLAKT